MAKETREIIKLFSSSGNGHFYSTTKNKRNNPKRITLKKFDPVLKKHTKYIEHKNNKFIK